MTNTSPETANARAIEMMRESLGKQPDDSINKAKLALLEDDFMLAMMKNFEAGNGLKTEEKIDHLLSTALAAVSLCAMTVGVGISPLLVTGNVDPRDMEQSLLNVLLSGFKKGSTNAVVELMKSWTEMEEAKNATKQ